MRVVLDTNQHISAIIRPNGHPAQIVKLWRVGLIELAISPAILEEFDAKDIFSYPEHPKIR